MKRKRIILMWILLVAVLLGASYGFFFTNRKTRTPIKVGLLHSLTGTMAISELPVVDATLMAIEEINQKGGILGRLIEPKVADGASDWPTFAKEAERLIVEEKVDVIFGCWTSASRKLVKEVVEKQRHLLFYPVQYEGLEQSPHIIYTGAAPNQQIIPGVNWSFNQLGKRFFIVGSDYVFPRVAGEIMKMEIASLGGEVVGEEYIPLGSSDVKAIVAKIVQIKPSVILNTINGDSNVAFFKALRAQGITPETIPTISFSINETELSLLGIAEMAGNYAAWNYFQSINTPTNQDFIYRFKKRYGPDRVLSDPMEAGYFGVYLWKQAVEAAKSSSPADVSSKISNQSYAAPEGIIYTDAHNHHTWKFVQIGKIRTDGQFNIVWNSKQAVAPAPYPLYYKSQEAWDSYLQSLYEMWGRQWAKPAAS